MKKPYVIEVINFLHELDILEAHIDEHQHFIDKLIVIESDKTYSGMDKPLYFQDNLERFEKYPVEHLVFPSEFFTPIPESYPEAENKKWFDARRMNREKQQQFIFSRHKRQADYVINADADEIWSRDCYDQIYDLMKEDYCYIAPHLRRFLYFADACGGKEDHWRITRSDQPTHVRQKGTKRDGTKGDVGWHFSAVFKDPWGLWMKGVGLAQSIGRHGWKDVESPEKLEEIFSTGAIPFLAGQNLSTRKVVMPVDDLSWMPPWMAARPDKWRWIPEKYREGRIVSKWHVGP